MSAFSALAKTSVAIAMIATAAIAMAEEAHVAAYRDQQVVAVATPKLDAAIAAMGCKICSIESNALMASFQAQYTKDGAATRILLDPRLESLTPAGLKFIVGHELGHASRFDPEAPDPQIVAINRLYSRLDDGGRLVLKRILEERHTGVSVETADVVGFSKALNQIGRSEFSEALIDVVGVSVANDVITAFQEEQLKNEKAEEFHADAFASKQLLKMGVDPRIGFRDAMLGTLSAAEPVVGRAVVASLINGDAKHPPMIARLNKIESQTGKSPVIEDEIVNAYIEDEIVNAYSDELPVPGMQ